MLWTSDCSYNLSCVGHSMCCKDHWLHGKGAHLPVMLPHMPGRNVAEGFPLHPTEPLILTELHIHGQTPNNQTKMIFLQGEQEKHGNGYERKCVLAQNLEGQDWVGNMRIFKERWQYSGFGMHEIFCMEHLLQWIACIPHWRNSAEVMVLNFPW